MGASQRSRSQADVLVRIAFRNFSGIAYDTELLPTQNIRVAVTEFHRIKRWSAESWSACLLEVWYRDSSKPCMAADRFHPALETTMMPTLNRAPVGS
jgi:hypothetical protein